MDYDKQIEKPNREYKDSVLVDLLTSNKVNMIEVYNALDHVALSKDTPIRYINIKNSLYTTLKNDVACLIEGKIIVLLEHQSTINENMPLRCLLYVARLYEKIIKPAYRYFKQLVKIPVPKFYVLYNGKDLYPENKTLRLSDAFIEDGKSLELEVEVININQGQNEAFLKSCKILNEYSQFIFYAKTFSEEKGIEGFKEAIDYCIKNNILSEYLSIRRHEVYNFLVAEYDYDLDMKMQGEETRRIAFNEGIAKGIAQGIAQGISQGIREGISQGISQGMAKGIREESINTAKRMKKANCEPSFIMEMTGLSKQEIEKL